MKIKRTISLILLASAMSFASNDTGFEVLEECEAALQNFGTVQEECRQIEISSKWVGTFSPTESEGFSGEDLWLLLDYFFPRENGFRSCAGRLDNAQRELESCEALLAE